MGMIYAEFELINGEDVILARKHLIGEDEIKRIRITALVDSGAYMLAINENMQKFLQLPVVDKKRFQLANGEILDCAVVGPVDLRFKDRYTTCRALVLPGDSEPLLGSIPLEELDVLIDPLRQELILNPEHPDGAVLRL